MTWWRRSRKRCIEEYLLQCHFTFAANGFQIQFVLANKSLDISKLRMYFRVGMYKLSPFRVYDDIGLFYKSKRPSISVPIDQPFGFNLLKALHPESKDIEIQLVDLKDKVIAEGRLPVVYRNEQLSRTATGPCRKYMFGEHHLSVWAK